MADFRAFRALRPVKEQAEAVASLPYDVYSSEEARIAVQRNSVNFLRIDRAETAFPAGTSPYEPEVYQKAHDLLREDIQKGVYTLDPLPSFYLYEETRLGKTQTGIVCLASIDDYVNNVIKKHENTTRAKEEDRVRHVDTVNAQTGPIFLAYRDTEALRKLIEKARETEPLFDFVTEDGVRQKGYQVPAEETDSLGEALNALPAAYIADGHHRAASAVRVGLMRRERGDDSADEASHFLSVLFPAEELTILPYNRYVRDWNAHTEADILRLFGELGSILPLTEEEVRNSSPEKGSVYFRISRAWYLLRFSDELLRQAESDPVKSLDVSLLQDHILSPIFGIEDPRSDRRIAFIGGIRGNEELERLEANGGIAFSMCATSMDELLRVADEGLLMPPKSTWFEPKLLSGLFLHLLGE